jgi:phosphotransferase family enzyme
MWPARRAGVTRIPEAPEDLTPEWLTEALSDAGVLERGRVSATRRARIGQEFGFTGVILRIWLQYEETDAGAPETLVAKLPMARDRTLSAYRKRQERDPLLADRYYDRSKREARFYADIGSRPAPAISYAAFDDVRRRVVLLLEDVDDGRQGDVLAGCTVEDAALVIDAIAPLHARWWGDRAPTRAFPPAATDDPRTRQERFARHVPRFLEAYGSNFPTEVSAVVERLGSNLAVVADRLSAGARTLVHGDLHLDNLIFRRDSAVVLDWQTVSVGAPAWEVALFLVGSLGVADRRDAEGALLERYVARLSEHGVSGYSVPDLQAESRLALLVLLAGTVVWLTDLAPEDLSVRERALKAATLTDGRIAAALADNGVEELLAGLASR